MSSFYLPYAVQCAEIAARLEATNVRGRMRRGVMSLASISATAAFFGWLGMVLGVMNSFHSIGGSRSWGLQMITVGISEAMAPGILGLAAAVIAFCCYRYLSGRLQLFDVEMRNETIELVNRLVVHIARLRVTNSALGSVLSARPSSSAMTPTYSDDVLQEGPRFILEPMYRHGMLELIWASDKELILDGSSWVCFAYGVIGFLAYCCMNRSLSGLFLLGFFGYAGWLIKRDPKASGAAVFIYFAAMAGTFVLSPYQFGWDALFPALAPWLILGSWRGTGAKNSGVLGRVGLVFVLAGACAAVSFGTVLGLYETEPGDNAVYPGVREGDWLIGVISSPGSPVYPGEIIEVNDSGSLAAAKVVGIKGDQVEVTGGFLMMGGTLYSRTRSPIPREDVGARVIGVYSPFRHSIIFVRQ